MTLDFTAAEVRLVSEIGQSVGSHWPRVTVADVKSELNLWLCENHHYVVRWRELGAHGRSKLALSLYRRANKYCRKEHETVKPTKPDWDYSTKAVAALLSALMQFEDWTEIVQDGNSDVWASLSDVSRAYESLNDTDRALLKCRLGVGLQFAEIAEELDLPSPDAARMRVNRALGRVAERASTWTVRWPARMDFKNNGRLQGAPAGDLIFPEMVEGVHS